MKNNLFLNTVRSVKRAPGRFVAIMAIIAISCAFYSGVKAACPDMKASAWKYYDECALADIQLKSTIGFEDTDAAALAADERFDRVLAGYSADLFIEGDHGRAAVKAVSYSNEQQLNLPYLIEGRLPENENECLADADSAGKITFRTGDRIAFEAANGEDIADQLNRTEFTVVGLIRSPLYVSYERGATNIGNGTLSAFVYIPKEAFALDAYTDIYLSVAAAHSDGIEPFSEEYEDIVAKAEEHLEMTAPERLDVRAQSIRAEVEEELSDARQQLADGEKEYNDGKAEYDKGKSEYDDAAGEFETQENDLAAAEKEYSDGLAEAAEQEMKLTNLSETCVRLDNFLESYDGVYMKVLPDPLLSLFKEIQEIYDENDIDASIEDLMAVYIITDPERDPASKAAAREAIVGINEQVRAASSAALYEIAAQKAVLEETGRALEEARTQLEDHRTELSDAKEELDSAEKELLEAREKISDAENEIADAEAKLDELLADSEWYVWNRDEFNPGCMAYGTDAERVDSIAAVFPLFFILVAALVCCTTMSRMVEEQRTEAGTLKSLGFGSTAIVMQYVLYAFIASVIGSIIGTVIGFQLLPNIIFICYDTMYNYPYIETPFMPLFALGCVGVSVLCTGLSAVYSSVRELSLVPALLIRPKPPKSGKRIFLERIGFIWKRLKFSYKVTFRNLLRYKSRFLMTIIGIGGCTALLLTAFGLKESVSCIADKQYDEIFLYDAIAVVSDTASEEETEEIRSAIASQEEIESYITAIQETKQVFSDTDSLEAYVFAPDSLDELSEYIVLKERVGGAPIELSDGSAVITEKLSRALGVGVGDTISIESAGLPIRVSGVTENYTFHYVYLTRDTFSSLFGNEASNMMLISTKGTPEKSVRDSISSELIACDAVISASFMYDGTDNFRKLVSSLDLIVIVLIVFAGALSFVILYNLANININERERELATIKVLGFFDGEVGAYIYRENTISAAIGIVCGLVLGIFFERFVVRTAEADEVMFAPDIPWFCFALAALAMVVFNVIVNAALQIKLKRIDMASSMKAIE